MVIALDWDDTLVDVHTQEWLPGALDALRAMCREHSVFIHSCRANWREGRASIDKKLEAERLYLDVIGKPTADVYIDDKAEKPRWTATTNTGGSPRTPTPMRAFPSVTTTLPRKVNGIVVY